MSAHRYDPADNSSRCYDLGVRAWREACIRKGQVAPDPRNPTEQRWAREGFHGNAKLEAVRNG